MINNRMTFLDGKTEEQMQKIQDDLDIVKVQQIILKDKPTSNTALKKRLTQEKLPSKLADYFDYDKNSKTFTLKNQSTCQAVIEIE